MIGNDRDQLGFDGGINLDLGIAMVGIPIYILRRLLGRIDTHLGRPGELPRTVNDAGFQYARTEFGAIIETRDTLQKSIRVICHVARACDAVSEIERTVNVAEMLMIIPQSRHQKSIMRIDNLGARGRFQIGVRPRTDDAIAAYEDTHSRSDRKIARIKQTRVMNQKIAFWSVCNLEREARRPNIVCSLLGFLQLRYRPFKWSLKDREPARHVCGRVTVVIEPNRLRGKRKPNDSVLRKFRFPNLKLA